VLAAEGRRTSTFNVDEFNAVLDSPCTFHKGATHTVRQCSQFKSAFRTRDDLKQSRGNDDRLSSRRYNNNRCDDRRGRGDDGRLDDRRHDEQQPKGCHDERDLPPPPVTSNPNGSF
jgi:hypothetical protein